MRPPFIMAAAEAMRTKLVMSTFSSFSSRLPSSQTNFLSAERETSPTMATGVEAGLDSRRMATASRRRSFLDRLLGL
jgi:hypothetical protein